MKFGDTLYQRSIPQWAPYNVDYNSLKQLIKASTTDIRTTPVSIPGQGATEEAWRRLEEQLFPVLRHQHEQTTRFIRSKHGELGRRLTQIEKQARQGVQRAGTPNSQPIQQTRKYRRLVEDASNLSKDIQALARFASTQKLAFRKILKKYRKWTGSTMLQTRMNYEVFNQPGSYLQPDLEPYLARLVEVSSTIRDLVRRRSDGDGDPGRRLRAAGVPGSDEEEFLDAVDFDAKFSAIRKDNQATYWIHKENLHEARVLLMSHVREWRGQRGALTTESSNMIVSDNPTRFSGEADWLRPELSARWDDGAEYAVVAEEHGASNAEARQSAISITRVACKDLLGVLQETSSNMGLTSRAHIESTRARFQVTVGVLVLATMETDILITSGPNGKTADKDPSFPHVVLDIRWTRNGIVPEAVLAFDQTHLAQRIPEFSIGFHAMHVVCDLATKLPWQDTLEMDIRRLPTNTRKTRGAHPRNMTITSSGQSSGGDSVFDSAGQQSSRTSIIDSSSPTTLVSLQASTEDLSSKKKKRIPFVPSFRKEAASQRYWNEFDDGEEVQDDAYAIYVDPDAPLHFPGAAAISKAFTLVSSGFQNTGKKLVSWRPFSRRNDHIAAEADEHAPLLLAGNTKIDGDVDIESSSSDSDIQHHKSRHPHRPIPTRTRSRPGTEPGETAYPWTSSRTPRNEMLTHAAAALHVISFLLLLLATLLKATGRKKAAVEVNAGVTVGWIGGLACGLVAMGCMASRSETIPWVEVCVVVLVGIGELVWGVCLGVWVAGAG